MDLHGQIWERKMNDFWIFYITLHDHDHQERATHLFSWHPLNFSHCIPLFHYLIRQIKRETEEKITLFLPFSSLFPLLSWELTYYLLYHLVCSLYYIRTLWTLMKIEFSISPMFLIFNTYHSIILNNESCKITLKCPECWIITDVFNKKFVHWVSIQLMNNFKCTTNYVHCDTRVNSVSMSHGI